MQSMTTPKQHLRLNALQARQSLSKEDQEKASQRICQRLSSLPCYTEAQNLALYYAIHHEVNLNRLWHTALSQGKTCYFPALHANTSLDFLPALPETPYTHNRYGIREPCVPREATLKAEQLDVILLPVVAFDPHGTRIGMGAGYYDRTLAGCTHPILLGVAYECQRQNYIEPQSWDVALHGIITEHATYWRS
jgi:5-formyltetrahydrofolate cyclo-ligase